MSRIVLDASALLAILNQEPGYERWVDRVASAVIGAVNLSEVIAKLADVGMPEPEIQQAVKPLGLEVIPFDERQAWTAGMLRPVTRPSGLSFADRACLALALQMKLPALAADRNWKRLRIGVRIQLLQTPK